MCWLQGLFVSDSCVDRAGLHACTSAAAVCGLARYVTGICTTACACTATNTQAVFVTACHGRRALPQVDSRRRPAARLAATLPPAQHRLPCNQRYSRRTTLRMATARRCWSIKTPRCARSWRCSESRCCPAFMQQVWAGVLCLRLPGCSWPAPHTWRAAGRQQVQGA